MAEITVTSNLIRPLEGAIVRRFDAGGALSAGDWVYVNTDGEVEQGDADVEAASQARGLVVADSTGATSFAAGQRVDVVVYGPVTGFSGMTPGDAIFVSVTAGAGDHTAPAAAGDYPFACGYAESAETVFVNPQAQEPVVNT